VNSPLGVAVIAVCLTAIVALFGWLIRDVLKGVRDDIGHLAGVLTEAADKMGGIDRRVTWLEAWLEHQRVPGGRRWHDPPEER
jgi:hypothetical protein